MLQTKIDRLIKGYERDGLTQRQINNRLKKEELIENDEKNQAPVQEMTINIEWKKSRTYGFCPSASATIKHKDGRNTRVDGYKASGCGYDKESTVVAQICNDTLKYLLWNVNTDDRQKAPYGVRFNDEFSHYFEGGVGVECYYKIIEFLGGKFEKVASGKTFDSYKITF